MLRTSFKKTIHFHDSNIFLKCQADYSIFTDLFNLITEVFYICLHLVKKHRYITDKQ